MNNKIYETTFEYYIKNSFHKVKKLRYELKSLLKPHFNIPIFKDKERKQLIRSNFSYDIKLIFKNKNYAKTKGKKGNKTGLIAIRIRTEKELTQNMKCQIIQLINDEKNLVYKLKIENKNIIIKKNNTGTDFFEVLKFEPDKLTIKAKKNLKFI